jgi:ferredoxin--NADP+ reductase
MSAQADHDLIVIGGGAGGLSSAISSRRAGLERVRVIESGAAVAFPELVPENQLDISYGEDVESITMEGELVRVTTNLHSYLARGCLIAVRCEDPDWQIPVSGAKRGDRVTVDVLPEGLQDSDVLVVGMTNNAVEVAAAAARSGAGVVLAAAGMDPAQLAPAADNMLRRLERERRLTVLYRSAPDEVGEVNGFPVSYFNDRRTPDLEFDHIVFASKRRELGPDSFGVSDEALAGGKVWFQGTPSDRVPNAASSWEVGTLLAEACFPELDAPAPPSALQRRVRNDSAVAELREDHYNATITKFEPTHSDLWVLRVKPDHGDTSHLPGQYASLGLGYWEDRIDDAHDPGMDDKWFKLIRRSYSISHPIFVESGYLAAPDTEELEFYIVLVPPTDDHVPALTPRLALKRPGDRIYLGPKVAGRYTLASVIDPESTVIFFATGTGEAPHNSMVTDLLRKGHTGTIISTVTVRNNADLGYLDEHRTLAKRFANYRYMPMPTREPEVAKRYLQDLIRDGDLERVIGGPLDPETTHAFLCGNPAMIGLPEEDEATGETAFPDTTGVVELLVDRGFSLDRRGAPGNIHYEEYW